MSETAHFRVELNGSNQATLAVFKGKVDATSPAGQVEVAEKHSATIKLEDAQLAKASQSNDAVASENTSESGREAGNSSRSETFVVAKNYEQEPSDAWDQQQTEYHDRYATSGGSNNINSPYSYGMSDLNYYGSFMSLPGYGNVWQPYFIGANWSPFQDGAWAFYPGNGYMWVSGYPWGWMPYDYGKLGFCSRVWMGMAARLLQHLFGHSTPRESTSPNQGPDPTDQWSSDGNGWAWLDRKSNS